MHTLASLLRAYRIDYVARLSRKTVEIYDTYLRAWNDDRRPTDVTARDIKTAAHERYGHAPASRALFLRVTSAFFRWLEANGYLAEAPEIEFVSAPTDGWEPWTADEVTLFRNEAPEPLARACVLGYRTAQRLGDCLALRWSDVQDGGIWFVQEKTGTRVFVPLHPDLESDMFLWPREHERILTDESGRPWGYHTFRQRFVRAAHKLGIEKSFHGLRKRACQQMIEDGCSALEAQAISGHRSAASFAVYIKERDQKKLAQNAVEKWR